jgi:hypothetical protein
MAAIPDGIVLKRHRDLVGRAKDAWIRRALLLLVGVVPLLALFNVFGQRPSVTTARSAKADLELYAPGHLRGGLLWEARFTISAHRDVKDAVLELDKGWLEGMTMNTIEPSPIGEGSNDGKLVLDPVTFRAAGGTSSSSSSRSTRPTSAGAPRTCASTTARRCWPPSTAR